MKYIGGKRPVVVVCRGREAAVVEMCKGERLVEGRGGLSS